jgi:hypothetical protein
MHNMDTTSAVRLHLLAPLVYAETPEPAPFAAAGEGERLLCFDLDPVQRVSIEPDRNRLLGNLIRAGRTPGGGTARSFTLPAGAYLFVQRRQVLDREGCVDLAIEQQKDGLWERLQPGSILYVRYLFEDGKAVTQLFRPL